MKSILHICTLDKFIPDFINFSRKYLSSYEQLYITYNTYKKYPYDLKDDAKHIDNKFFRYLKINYELYKKDVVLIHGLFDPYLMLLLFIQPWLLNKCRWLVWGGDVYHLHKLYEGKYSLKKYIREFVIKHMGYIVTSIDGDYEAIKNLYHAQGKRIDLFAYPAALFQELPPEKNENTSIKIMVGNSADSSNNHAEVFHYLAQKKLNNVEIIVPLSYGVQSYKEATIKLGFELFGDSFKPLTNFINYDDYLKILSSLDIIIFNHDRQQAMSTARVALGMGKKVCMKQGLSSSAHFDKLGIKTFKLSDLELTPYFSESSKNIEVIKAVYSVEQLINNLNILYSNS